MDRRRKLPLHSQIFPSICRWEEDAGDLPDTEPEDEDYRPLFDDLRKDMPVDLEEAREKLPPSPTPTDSNPKNLEITSL